MDNHLLKDLLRERVELKGLTVLRLRQQTGIAERYLSAFLEGNHEKLPALPYVRGYLMHLATLLDLDGNELWETYQRETKTMKSSGATDVLPHNRFALQRLDRRKVAAGIAAALVLIYLLVNINRFLGKPPLTVSFPPDQPTTTATSSLTITGTADPRDTVRVDGVQVTLSATGSFETTYELTAGLNSIEITSERLLGRTTAIVRQVIYEPPVPNENETPETEGEELDIRN